MHNIFTYVFVKLKYSTESSVVPKIRVHFVDNVIVFSWRDNNLGCFFVNQYIPAWEWAITFVCDSVLRVFLVKYIPCLSSWWGIFALGVDWLIDKQ